MARPLAEPLPERSFERLYRRHVADVYRYASAVLANPADAEDVTQTTFMNAYRAFERGQRPEQPLNWLITIAHNVCRQRFRQQSRRPSEVRLDFDVADELVDEERVRAEDIGRALSQLAFNQRAALVMRELEGRSYPEIAEALQLSQSAVETLLFRARRALREQLEATLTCDEAERAVSRQLDGMLGRRERGALRAHLRACPDCASLARGMRAQRSSLKALAALPLPASLANFSLGGGAATAAGAAGAGGVLLKIAAVTAAGLAASGAGYEAVVHRPWAPVRQAAAAPILPAAAAQTRGPVTTGHPAQPQHPVTPAEMPRPSRAQRNARRAKTLISVRPAQAQSGHTNTHAVPAAAKPAQPGRSSTGRAAEEGRHSTGVSHASPSAHAATATTTTQNSGAPAAPSPTNRARTQAATACTQAQSDDLAAFALTYSQKQAQNATGAFSRCVLAHLRTTGAPGPGGAQPNGRPTSPPHP